MGVNQFLAFGTGGSANVIDQVTYSGLAARTSGFSAGTALSAQLNKVWRQSSVIAAMIGQLIADYSGSDANDDGDIPTLEARYVSAMRKLSNAIIQQVSASVASNALTLSYAGGSLDFRSATLSNGAPITGVAVPANSIIVPSGATLGMVSGQAGRLALLEAYNGGSPVLCVANLSGGLQLDETNLISPTTISTSATSASVIYSASAVAASSPYRVVGFVDISEVTAGTWASSPTLVQGVGGQALAALSSLGFGQTYQSVTRVAGTTYYNTTGKPIFISFYWSAPSQVQADVRVNGIIADSSSNVGATGFGTARAIVPPNASYSISGSGITIGAAYELR